MVAGREGGREVGRAARWWVSKELSLRGGQMHFSFSHLQTSRQASGRASRQAEAGKQASMQSGRHACINHLVIVILSLAFGLFWMRPAPVWWWFRCMNKTHLIVLQPSVCDAPRWAGHFDSIP